MRSLSIIVSAVLLCAPPTGAQAGQPARVPAPAPARPPSPAPAAATRAPAPAAGADACSVREIARLGRNPTAAELRCRYGVRGPGKFGLLSYLDVPVYQPRTPQPGTHVVGVPGMPKPRPGESFEEWEWRVLRTRFGRGVQSVYRGLEQADPIFASRLMRLERMLRERGIPASRRETYRPAERQAYVFQQGRSRSGPIATSTLTSWHSRVDRLGRPAARAADYNVSPRNLPRFHALADSLGLMSYGADSNDPGHVYLPDTDAAAGLELAVLRLVPRVPHVTLETGRPFGEPRIPGMPNYWRELTAEFITRPRPFPREELAAAGPPALRIRVPPPPPPAPAPLPDPRRRGRSRRG